MRKVGDVMKDLGFNKDSSTETQKAFVKHLIKAAYGVEVRENDRVIPHQKPFSRQASTKAVANPHAVRTTKKSAQDTEGQLSFDFDKKDDVESA